MPLSINMYRIAVGALGGFAAILVKFLAQHEARISELNSSGQLAAGQSLAVAFVIMAPALVFLGGLIG
jgi:hypothetical protein